MPDLGLDLPWPIPPVEASDIEKLWNFLREARETFERENPGHAPNATVGFDPAVIAEATGCKAAPIIIFVRAALIEMMIQSDLIRPWLEAGRPTGPVFELAAKWPLPAIEAFNVYEFLGSLKKMRPKEGEGEGEAGGEPNP